TSVIQAMWNGILESAAGGITRSGERCRRELATCLRSGVLRVGGVRGDGPIRPLAHHQKCIVLFYMHKWPFLAGCLMLERHHLANRRQRPHDLRIESGPHFGVPSLDWRPLVWHARAWLTKAGDTTVAKCGDFEALGGRVSPARDSVEPDA